MREPNPAPGYSSSQQAELWVILDDAETSHVWDMVDALFCFHPSYEADGIPPFVLQEPVDLYDISGSPLYRDDETLIQTVKSIFVEAMADDAFMYALDWQHTCFKYNPRIEADIEYPVFVQDSYGGYNVYFPEFYPNGDYFLFVAADFRWGYLTHPWRKQAWVFGEQLMPQFRQHAKQLGFVICTEQPPSAI